MRYLSTKLLLAAMFLALRCPAATASVIMENACGDVAIGLSAEPVEAPAAPCVAPSRDDGGMDAASTPMHGASAKPLATPELAVSKETGIEMPVCVRAALRLASPPPSGLLRPPRASLSGMSCLFS